MTVLAWRPLEIRLMVAYMATAGRTLVKCDPESTLDRQLYRPSGGTKEYNPADPYYNMHPYSRMWFEIGDWYTEQGFDKMSDARIKEKYMTALATDKRVARARDTWAKYDWKEYETRRNSRRQTAGKYALPAVSLVGICFGLVLPQP